MKATNPINLGSGGTRVTNDTWKGHRTNGDKFNQGVETDASTNGVKMKGRQIHW